MSLPERSMRGILLVEESLLCLHHRHRLHKMQIRRLRPKLRPRRKLLLKPRPRLRPLLFYHLHNLNNTPKVKGEARAVESQEHQVKARETRRRYHAISTLSRNLARKGKIVNTVMIRRPSTLARLADWGREVERRRGANLQQTGQRR